MREIHDHDELSILWPWTPCGAAALMVEDRNPAALALYRNLGMRYQPVAVAAAV